MNDTAGTNTPAMAVGLVNASEEVIGAPTLPEGTWLVPLASGGGAVLACVIALTAVSVVWRRSTAALLANPREVAMRRIARLVKAG
jgi:hypothetical protein